MDSISVDFRPAIYRVGGIIGNQPTCNFAAFRIIYGDRIAPRKISDNLAYAGCQQRLS